MTSLVETIKTSLTVEVRQATEDGRYFEGVLRQEDLPQCLSLVQSALGPPLKDFNQPVRLATDVQAVVNRYGGIRLNQCLFFKRDGGTNVFAMFWPWESNPARITLKLGTA